MLDRWIEKRLLQSNLRYAIVKTQKSNRPQGVDQLTR